MRIGLGGLGFRPVDFWAMTLTEFFEAIHGRNAANGEEQEPAAPTDKEMASLLERYG